MCPFSHPWNILWPTGPWQEKSAKNGWPYLSQHPHALTLLFCLLCGTDTLTKVTANSSEAFRWLGTLLTIQNPLLGPKRSGCSETPKQGNLGP